MTRYLTGDKERVLWQDTRGVASLDLREMVREMESTVRMPSRCQKRVYHVTHCCTLGRLRPTTRPNVHGYRSAEQ